MSDIRDNWDYGFRDYTGSDTDERDFPANTSTTGLVESGWLDYGRIYPAGDVDWFKVNLTAGVYYKFQVEAGTINGLFDPNLALYDSGSQLLATATMGQGFQSKWVELTPATSGRYYLAASGSSELYGNYNLYILDGATSAANASIAPALATPEAMTFSDSSANDTFIKQLGTLSGTDADGDKLTYGIDGVKSGVKAGTYGTLKVNTKTGGYTYTPNDKAIEALSSDATETFTVTVKDKTNTVMASLVINLTGAIDLRTGTEANNKLIGTEGIDNITGAGGADNLTGLAGNDTLDGGDGKDILNSGNGDDRLIGEAGSDNLTGGKGIDTFVFNGLGVSADADKILDFASEDVLEFSTSVFTQLVGATEVNFVKGKAAVDTDDYLIYDNKSLKLYYDADGSGAEAAILITGIRGAGAKTLSIDDFSFV